MRKDLEKQLYNKYPEFFKQKDLPASETCMSLGIETGSGWFYLIDELVGKIIKLDPKVEATQVKEKFGLLRIYTTATKHEVWDLIDKYQKKSAKVCEECGSKGKHRKPGGWFLTLCDDCFIKYCEEKKDILKEGAIDEEVNK